MFKRAKMYRAIGLMSGTSYDGIDIGLIKTDGEKRIELLNSSTVPYPKSLRDDIARLINGDYTKIWEVERSISDLHSMATRSFIRSFGMVDIIGFHGQSIIHRPEEGICVQIGNPHVIASSLKIDVVHDFRRGDVVRGGQGAPLVPVFLKAIRPYTNKPACFLNIGGVANICYVSDKELIAFDTGPGNAPLNDICKKHLGVDHDDGGKVASEGMVDHKFVKAMLRHRYLAKDWPKSLDRNAFDFSGLKNMHVHDMLATVVEFIAHTIELAVAKLPTHPNEIIVSGGGVHNAFLLERIHKITGVKITPSSKYKLPADHLEAYAFAYLAVRSKLGLPISFPSTTGVTSATTGGVLVRG